VFVAETADIIGPNFPFIRLFFLRQTLDPLEALEEVERLQWWTGGLLSGFESIGELASGMGHAPQMSCAFQCAPGRIAVAHQQAAIITEKRLGYSWPPPGW
jgi:hypothetical protein